MTHARARAGEALVLVTGHECRGVEGLDAVAAGLAPTVVVCSHRVVHHQVRALLAEADVVQVLPMTWGRDPVLVADTAKALRWFATSGSGEPPHGGPRVALCDSLGTPDHLVAHLRRAAREVAAHHPGAALLVTAPSSNPFDDAELHRLAHLVRTYGAGVAVEVALLGERHEADDLDLALTRCRRLGADHVVVVSAGFARTCPVCEGRVDVEFHGPLVPATGLARTVADRLARARHRLEHGDDGIAAGLGADHGYGYAHSHEVPGEGHGHAHHEHQHHEHQHHEHQSHEHQSQGQRTSPRRDTDTTPAVREPSEVSPC